MNCVASESRSLPYQTSLFGEQAGHFSADELIRHRLLAVRVDLVRVGHLPRTAGRSIVIALRRTHRLHLGLFGVERVAIWILRTAHLAITLHCIHLEDGVLGSVDVGVYPQAEKMLVVVGVDSGVDFGAPRSSVFAGS